jgi:hypothetical protein
MNNIEKQLSEQYKPQAKKLGVISYTVIQDVISKKDEIINMYNDILNKQNIHSWDFEEFLDINLNINNIHENDIYATKLKNNNFYIYLTN